MPSQLSVRAIIPTWSLRGRTEAFIAHVNNIRKVMNASPNVDKTKSGVLVIEDNPNIEEQSIIQEAVNAALRECSLQNSLKIVRLHCNEEGGVGYKKFKGLELALGDELNPHDLAVVVNDHKGHHPENIMLMVDAYLQLNLEMIIGARSEADMIDKLPGAQLFYETRVNQMVNDRFDFSDVFGGCYPDFVFGVLLVSRNGWNKLYAKIVEWEHLGKLSFWDAAKAISFGFDVFVPIIGKAANLEIGSATLNLSDLKQLVSGSSSLEGRQKQFAAHMKAIEIAIRFISGDKT